MREPAIALVSPSAIEIRFCVEMSDEACEAGDLPMMLLAGAEHRER